MTNDEFYRTCAEILDTTYDCESFPHDYRTRWNNRRPGNGRFPDHGIIRIFGDMVQIALRAPVAIQCNVEGRQAAIELLRERIATHRE